MRILAAALAASILASPARAAGAGAALALQDGFADIIAKARPAVVNIQITQERRVSMMPQFYFGDPEELFEQYFSGQGPHPRTYRYKQQGTGSGFIIDPAGLVLTNEHVVRGADQIEITLVRPGQADLKLPGRVVGKDPSLDLAVVKIQAQGPFPFLRLADSSKVRVGNFAIAIGSPFELQQTVTLGIISAVRASLLIEGRRYANMLQTDAAINRGNSGGPLLDANGDVVGINTAIYSPAGVFAGIGFAIPADEARAVVGLLEQGKTVKRGWLGVGLVPVDEVIRGRFGLPEASGALVNKVFPQSPAEKAGLRRGDVIVSANGKKARGLDDVIEAASRVPPGSVMGLKVWRSGRIEELTVRLGERPAWAEAPSEEGGPEGREPAEPAEPPAGPPPAQEPPPPAAQAQGPATRWEGMEVAPAGNGVRVQRLARDSKLYGYLREGDVVQGINQQPVRSTADFEKAVKGANLAQGVVFDVVRDGQPLYVSIQAN